MLELLSKEYMQLKVLQLLGIRLEYKLIRKDNKILRIYPNKTYDVLVEWPNEYIGELILKSRISKMKDELNKSGGVIKVESENNSELSMQTESV